MGVGNATYSTLVQYDSVISVRASRVGGNDGARMMAMRMMRTATTTPATATTTGTTSKRRRSKMAVRDTLHTLTDPDGHHDPLFFFFIF
jgi:hypothetical protein